MKDPKQTPNTIHFTVEKDLIAGRFFIREKWLKIAKKGKRIVIEYKGERYACTYREWMKGAKKMEKEFLIPNHPMILYGNYPRKLPLHKEVKVTNEPFISFDSRTKLLDAWKRVHQSI